MKIKMEIDEFLAIRLYLAANSSARSYKDLGCTYAAKEYKEAADAVYGAIIDAKQESNVCAMFEARINVKQENNT